jgi:S1-C subfamily serine protease
MNRRSLLLAALHLLWHAAAAFAQTVPVDAAHSVSAKLRDCSLRVKCNMGDGLNALGSSVAVEFNNRKLIVTNYHVIDGAKSVQVCQVGGKYRPAVVVATDPLMDLAVLNSGDVAAKRWARVGLFAESRPHTLAGFGGDGVLHFHKLTPSRWRGVSPLGGSKYSWVIFKGGCCHGDSGGGIFNGHGEAIGVVWGTADGDSHAVVGLPFREILEKATKE